MQVATAPPVALAVTVVLAGAMVGQAVRGAAAVRPVRGVKLMSAWGLVVTPASQAWEAPAETAVLESAASISAEALEDPEVPEVPVGAAERAGTRSTRSTVATAATAAPVVTAVSGGTSGATATEVLAARAVAGDIAAPGVSVDTGWIPMVCLVLRAPAGLAVMAVAVAEAQARAKAATGAPVPTEALGLPELPGYPVTGLRVLPAEMAVRPATGVTLE